MAKFKDNTGRAWDLSLSVGLLGKLRTGAGFALTKADAAAQLAALMDDPEQLARVLWVLVEKQAGDITPEAFGFALGGDAIEDAVRALFEATIDFFQRAGAREAARKNLSKILSQADAAMVKEIERLTAEALKTSAGSSPASSA